MSKEAMKLALKRAFQLGQDYWYQADHDSYRENKKSDETLAKFRQLVDETCEALAEQPAQQEPVTWGVDWGKAGDIPCVSIIKRLLGGGIEVVAVEYAPYEYNPPAQQEPVAFLVDGDLYYPEEIDWETLQEQGHTVASLYTSPPQRKPLSEEWIAYCWRKSMIGTRIHYVDYLALVREIERAHGIKEGK